MRGTTMVLIESDDIFQNQGLQVIDESDNKRLPVCIVLGEGVTALGVIRSLGRAGISQYAISNQCDVSALSRWNVTEPSSVDAGPEPGNLSAWLSDLSIDEGVLMPCSDGWTKAVAQLDSSVAHRFHSWVPKSECGRLSGQ